MPRRASRRSAKVQDPLVIGVNVEQTFWISSQEPCFAVNLITSMIAGLLVAAGAVLSTSLHCIIKRLKMRSRCRHQTDQPQSERTRTQRTDASSLWCCLRLFLTFVYFCFRSCSDESFANSDPFHIDSYSQYSRSRILTIARKKKQKNEEATIFLKVSYHRQILSMLWG